MYYINMKHVGAEKNRFLGRSLATIAVVGGMGLSLAACGSSSADSLPHLSVNTLRGEGSERVLLSNVTTEDLIGELACSSPLCKITLDLPPHTEGGTNTTTQSITYSGDRVVTFTFDIAAQSPDVEGLVITAPHEDFELSMVGGSITDLAKTSS